MLYCSELKERGSRCGREQEKEERWKVERRQINKTCGNGNRTTRKQERKKIKI